MEMERDLPRLVACAVIIRDGKVLLEKCALMGIPGLDGFWNLFWDLPGGIVKNFEDPPSAVVREIDEKLGVKVKPIQMVPFLPISSWVYPNGERRHWVIAAYLCEITYGEPVCSDNLQWFNLATLPENILDADHNLLESAVVLLSRLG